MRVQYPKCANGPYCWFNPIENGVYILVEVSFYIADDTTIYGIFKNVAAGDLLNLNLHEVHKWSEKWLVNFNPKNKKVY